MPSITTPPSATSDRETTVYSEVRTDLKVKVTSNVNKYGKCSSLLARILPQAVLRYNGLALRFPPPIDRSVTLHNIMVQLRPLTHKWSDFSNFLELTEPGIHHVS